MFELPAVPFLFIALAVIFIALAVQNYLKSEGKLTPARKTWLRIAFIFSAVAIGVYLMNRYLG